jgi:hypothetical protein
MAADLALHRKLGEATRRVRALLVFQWTARILCWTALACVVWLLAAKIHWLPEPEPAMLVGILTVAAAVGMVIGLSRRVTLLDIARLTDSRTEMKERLASAVEFEGLAASDPLARRQVEDANAHARQLDLRKVYPMRFSWEMAGFLTLALVLFLMFLLPSLPMFWPAKLRQEAAEVKKQGVEIEKLAKSAEKAAAAKKLDETKKAAKEAQKLAQAMKRGNMTKKTAMVKMSKLTKQIQDQQKKLAALNTPAQKSMEQAAAEAKQALQQQQKSIEDAAKAKAKADAKGQPKTGEKQGEKQDAKQGENKNSQKGDQKGDQKGGKQENKPGETQQSQAMQESQRALQQFTEALAQDNPDAQNQALQKLAEQMEKGQMSKQEMQQLQKQMEQLAKALKGTKLDQVSKQMAELAKKMQELKLDPETLKKLAQMMRQAGGT